MSTAVVTGAGSGIGRAVALALAKRGVDVALWGRTRGPLEQTARAVEALGTRAHATVRSCDIARSSEVSEAARELVAAAGAPRIVVNNAGVVGAIKRVHELSDDEWHEAIGVNLHGAFYVTRAFLPSMLAAKTGRVVTVASISSTLGTPRLSPYVTAKWGELGLMKSLAEELRGSGLQAMTVLPGTVDTPMVAAHKLFPPVMSADDVAKVVVFAALDAPDAMNGSAIEVFGP